MLSDCRETIYATKLASVPWPAPAYYVSGFTRPATIFKLAQLLVEHKDDISVPKQ